MRAAPFDADAIEAVLFDVYGTLLQITRPSWPYKRLVALAQAERPDLNSTQAARDLMCRPVNLAEARSMYRLTMTATQVDALEQQLREELASIRFFPEAADVLRALRGRGYRLGVCSNLAAPYVAPATTLLSPLTDAALWSCEVGSMKPDPAIYEEATARLGVAPNRCLMVGDTLVADVKGARAAGLQALHLNRNGVGDLAELTELFSLLGA